MPPEPSTELQAAAFAELLTEHTVISMHRCEGNCCLILYFADNDEYLYGIARSGDVFQVPRGALHKSQWRPLPSPVR